METAQNMAETENKELQTEGRIPVTVAYGDGIGPEIMEATLRILDAADAGLHYDVIDIGEAVYLKGISSGIPDDAWETIRANSAFLKAPITTPQGGGYKSLNVTIRKSFNLFANVRPAKTLTPFVESQFPGIDLVIVRENEEDLYAGIEHRQTNEVYQTLKLVSRPGTERIVRYAFEYARAYGRKRVTCMTKDNIMKLSDGLFHQVFNEVAMEYPEIEADHYIIDIGAARLATNPEKFDVVVTLNLYGDILSDITSQVSGSVGLGGSANIGPTVSMFEAVHGSAPDIAGQNIANPSGLLSAATMMLVHLGKGDVAARIANAWLRTLEEGIHTGDIWREGKSRERVGTIEFADAVIERLGRKPEHLQPAEFGESKGIVIDIPSIPRAEKQLVGIDVFLDWHEGDRNPERLGKGLRENAGEGIRLKMITNRGVKVYPEGIPETFLTDHWRCRFVSADGGGLNFGQALALQQRLNDAGYEVIKTENLYTFDGERGYSLGQGE